MNATPRVCLFHSNLVPPIFGQPLDITSVWGTFLIPMIFGSHSSNFRGSPLQPFALPKKLCEKSTCFHPFLATYSSNLANLHPKKLTFWTFGRRQKILVTQNSSGICIWHETGIKGKVIGEYCVERIWIRKCLSLPLLDWDITIQLASSMNKECSPSRSTGRTNSLDIQCFGPQKSISSNIECVQDPLLVLVVRKSRNLLNEYHLRLDPLTDHDCFWK